MERPAIDHYQTLGICHTADLAQIKETYAHLALATHQDMKSGAAGSEVLDEEFALVSESFAVLSDRIAKSSFDEKFKEFYASKHGCEVCEERHQRLWEELRRTEDQLWDARDEIDTGVANLDEVEEELAIVQNELENEREERKRKERDIVSLKEQLTTALAEIQTLKNLNDTAEGTRDCNLAVRNM